MMKCLECASGHPADHLEFCSKHPARRASSLAQRWMGQQSVSAMQQAQAQAKEVARHQAIYGNQSIMAEQMLALQRTVKRETLTFDRVTYERAIADAMELRRERDELLKENAVLRRKVERLERCK